MNLRNLFINFWILLKVKFSTLNWYQNLQNRFIIKNSTCIFCWYMTILQLILFSNNNNIVLVCVISCCHYLSCRYSYVICFLITTCCGDSVSVLLVLALESCRTTLTWLTTRACCWYVALCLKCWVRRPATFQAARKSSLWDDATIVIDDGLELKLVHNNGQTPWYPFLAVTQSIYCIFNIMLMLQYCLNL